MSLRDGLHDLFTADRIGCDWVGTIPRCSESCVQYDCKRCRVIGQRPESICEPAVELMSEVISDAIATVTVRPRSKR